jgi:hypothetical protein
MAREGVKPGPIFDTLLRRLEHREASLADLRKGAESALAKSKGGPAERILFAVRSSLAMRLSGYEKPRIQSEPCRSMDVKNIITT